MLFVTLAKMRQKITKEIEEKADHFMKNPGDLDGLFSKVSAVLAEFGEAISEFAAIAYEREAIGVIKITDACHVLEDNMHIRVVAFENVGEIFFID